MAERLPSRAKVHNSVETKKFFLSKVSPYEPLCTSLYRSELLPISICSFQGLVSSKNYFSLCPRYSFSEGQSIGGGYPVSLVLALLCRTSSSLLMDSPGVTGNIVLSAIQVCLTLINIYDMVKFNLWVNFFCGVTGPH